jgi:hypothetical protein
MSADVVDAWTYLLGDSTSFTEEYQGREQLNTSPFLYFFLLVAKVRQCLGSLDLFTRVRNVFN